MCGLTNPSAEAENTGAWQAGDDTDAERKAREAADAEAEAVALSEAYDYDWAMGYLI
jgi:hypothetical protein